MLQEAEPETAAVDAATEKLLKELDNGEGVGADEAGEADAALDEALLLDLALGPLDAEFDGAALLEEP